MGITIEYKTPEKGSVEHKELSIDTEIKFIPDYEVLNEEVEELEDYFAKLNGFPCTYMECYDKIGDAYDRFYDKYCDKCKDIKGEVVYDEVCREGCELFKEEFKDVVFL